MAIPLAIGTFLTAKGATPTSRGLGLGVIIGWALAPIVFAGVCILIIFGAYSATGS